MAYYENKVERFDGNLILYQRNLKTAVPSAKAHRAAKWYMKLRLGPKTVINRSTGLTSYEEAYSFAWAEYNRLTNAIALGHTLKDFTFEQHWDDWYRRNLNLGTWKEDRQRWHKNLAARYFKAYFRKADCSSMRLNEINAAVAQGYWDWRISYWSSQQGEKLASYNPKRRKAKTTATNNAVKVPSKKTLQMDQTALNQIFNDAREQGRLQQQFKLKAPTDNRPHVRRPHFEDNERERMVAFLRSYRDVVGHFKDDRVNAWHKLQRQQLYHFVIFMLNSGLRVGEAREMRWRDIKFDQPHPDSERDICVVEVRKNTKTSQNRDVQTQANANKTLKEWREKSPFTGANDYVWFGQTGKDGKQKRMGDLNKSFQTFLERLPIDDTEHGLLFNKEGERRCIYSLRHTYATIRRAHGVSWEDLALNMGCKRDQLEKHYDHSTSNERREGIVKIKAKAKKPAKVEPSVDPFVAEAFRRYQEGQLDDAAFMAIMKSTKAAS